MLGGTALFSDEATVPEEAQSIAQARNKRAQFLLNFATFGDDNGAAISDVLDDLVHIHLHEMAQFGISPTILLLTIGLARC